VLSFNSRFLATAAAQAAAKVCVFVIFACVLFPTQLVQPMNASLESTDPEIFDIIEKEKQRQRESIVLIPSEVCVCCHD
jgi:glycine hydroxymethyltransferase